MKPWIPYNKPYKECLNKEAYDTEIEYRNLDLSPKILGAMTEEERRKYDRMRSEVYQKHKVTETFISSLLNTPGVQIKLKDGTTYLIGEILKEGSYGNEYEEFPRNDIVTHYRILCDPNED